MHGSASKDFFISYNRKDRQWAEWIAWQLEEHGKFSVIIQAWDIKPGSNFIEKMDAALKNANRTLLVLTPNALESKYVKLEWTTALNEERLVPVRVVEFDPTGMLGTHAYIDLVSLDEIEARERLLRRLGENRTKPPSSPAYPGQGPGGKRAVPERPTYPGAHGSEATVESGDQDETPGEQPAGTSIGGASAPGGDGVETPRVTAASKALSRFWTDHRGTILLVVAVVFVSSIWYRIQVYSRLTDNLSAQAHSYVRHMAEQDSKGIAQLVRTPFFFGEQRLDSQTDVRAYFSRLFERAAESRQSSSALELGPAMHRGILLARWANRVAAVPGSNLVGATNIDVRVDIYSGDEREEPTGPLPTFTVGDGVARADVRFGGFESDEVSVMHLYFATDPDPPELYGAIIR